MHNSDWSTLDIGKSWKWGVVLFKSNCIILCHYLSIDAKHIIQSLKRQQNKCIWNCLLSLCIEAKIMDQYQTAPTGAVWSGSTLFVYEASNILVDHKKTYILCLCTFRVNKCEFSVYTVRIFMKCTHVCAAQKAY